MNDQERKRETRRQNALDRLGTIIPAARFAAKHWRCLEAHHVAGRAYDEFTTIVCRNCHRKLSDVQKDQPPKADDPSCPLMRIGHFITGLGEFLRLLAEQLCKFGGELIALAIGASTDGEARS